MTLGDKLSKLRRENNYTQEQLAELLNVSRQAISKWESNISYPETDKLIRIGTLFNCSLDYLLKEECETPEKPLEDRPDSNHISFCLRKALRERKSSRTLWGLPLWHIAKNAKCIVAIGVNARGVVAIGMKAKGIISLGMLSAGILSFGFLSLGLLSIGLFALGALSAGCICAGILSAGAISFGILSFGAVAIGDFSVGALAVGKYIAIGDHARSAIALGDTYAAGNLYQKIGRLTAQDIAAIKALLDSSVPEYLSWAKEVIKQLI
ncbi:MAG: helix-turn-helix transcriptional regulator [Clostridiales bacterium]|nr:helix-turn-helix transcriptional regulator [Clostridiales bacterium]